FKYNNDIKGYFKMTFVLELSVSNLFTKQYKQIVLSNQIQLNYFPRQNALRYVNYIYLPLEQWFMNVKHNHGAHLTDDDVDKKEEESLSGQDAESTPPSTPFTPPHLSTSSLTPAQIGSNIKSSSSNSNINPVSSLVNDNTIE